MFESPLLFAFLPLCSFAEDNQSSNYYHYRLSISALLQNYGNGDDQNLTSVLDIVPGRNNVSVCNTISLQGAQFKGSVSPNVHLTCMCMRAGVFGITYVQATMPANPRLCHPLWKRDGETKKYRWGALSSLLKIAHADIISVNL